MNRINKKEKDPIERCVYCDEPLTTYNDKKRKRCFECYFKYDEKTKLTKWCK